MPIEDNALKEINDYNGHINDNRDNVDWEYSKNIFDRMVAREDSKIIKYQAMHTLTRMIRMAHRSKIHNTARDNSCKRQEY
jgi:hypothetical protein